MKMRLTILICFIFLVLTIGLTACQRQKKVCPPPEGTPKTRPDLMDLIAIPPPKALSEPITVEINGKTMTVDKLVEGPLCNDHWSGIVYVGCDVIVAEASMDADENPRFFEGCNLNIEPNTVVYVAAHNDAAYYKGCSCHTGEDPIP
jgi:hypothetical protein